MLPSLKSNLSTDPAVRLKKHQISVWLLTFFIYIVFHMTRKTYSVVKSSLNPAENDLESGFAPFIGLDGKSLLGALDTVFLLVYAICLFFAGHIGDNSDLRVFLPVGLVGCADGLLMWPIAYVLDIHYFSFFVLANIISGVFQSTGWPSVVCIMSRWFPKGKRGLIMGVWNAHTSIGNMLGSLVGAAMVHYTMDGAGWPWAFTVPAVVSLVMAAITWMYLIPHPEDVGLTVDAAAEDTQTTGLPADQALLPPHLGPSSSADLVLPSLHSPSSSSHAPVPARRPIDHEVVEGDRSLVTFFTAVMLPGVVEFSMALFFCKLVAYTFLFWLPYYLTTFYDSGMASYLSIYFDMGGILGGIVAGVLADRLKKPALISVCAMVLCMPVLLGYRMVSEQAIGGVGGNIAVMFVLGAFVNGPYALITTAVSADLGSHPMLGADASALATVSGIVDGMGTLGAAAQGVLVSLVSTSSSDGGQNWDAVFFMLIACCGLAALCLTRLVTREVRELLSARLRIRPSRRAGAKERERASLMTAPVDTDTEAETDHVAMVLDKYKRKPLQRS